jgi:serine protease AprX
MPLFSTRFNNRFMKKPLLTLLLVFFAASIFSQPQGPAYVIHFTDKDNSPYSISKPEEFLTAAALERRTNQGIAIHADDIPVNSSYLSAVSNQGAQIAAVSRWFNTAAVWINNPVNIAAIEALPFVDEVVPMSGEIPGTSHKKSWENKPFFETESSGPLVASVEAMPGFNDFYNYGGGLNQIQMINGVGLHNQGHRGKNMVIAVLDAGFRNVDVISAFDSLRAHDRILGTKNFVEPGNNVYDPGIHPHGTNVLSIMAANLPGQMIGTAPEASYWLIRTEDANGPQGNSEYLMEEYYWIAGAEFADSVGAWVINSSLGYSEFDDPSQNHTYADMDGNTTPVTRAANRAAEKGILVVNSAGNSGGSAWQHIIAPSDGFQVMAVGAVNANGIYASFSSTGPSYDGRVKPDITAQGSGTFHVNSNGSVDSGNGTSYSSPVMAGMAACLWQSNTSVGNMDVYEAIIQSASQYLSPDNFLGHGIPDFEQAQLILTSDNIISDEQERIRVYPNPVGSYVVIETNQTAGEILGAVFIDVTGRTLLQYTNNAGSPTMVVKDFGSIQPGIYFLKVDLPYGSETIRILKQ